MGSCFLTKKTTLKELTLRDVDNLQFSIFCTDERARDFIQIWTNYIEMLKNPSDDKSEWYLIDMEWFKAFKSKYSITDCQDNVEPNKFDNKLSEEIDNSNLLCDDRIKPFNILSIDNEDQQSLLQDCYTGKILKNSIELNKDYTILNKEIYDFICNICGCRCSNPILRYAYKYKSSSEAIIEINLQRVRVIFISESNEDNNFKFLQFSKYETINGLYNRLIDPANPLSQKFKMAAGNYESAGDEINGIEHFYSLLQNDRIKCVKLETNDERLASQVLNQFNLLIFGDLQFCNSHSASKSIKNEGENISINDENQNLNMTHPILNNYPPNSNFEENKKSKKKLRKRKVKKQMKKKSNVDEEQEESKESNPVSLNDIELKDPQNNPQPQSVENASLDKSSRKSSISKPDYSDGNKGLCGLKNLGNTCYMNAVLQALCHTPDIRDYFLGGEYYKDKMNYGLICNISEELHTIFLNMWMGDENPYNPERFKAETKEYIELLNNNEQQDSADLLIQLLELIHNEQTKISIDKNEEFKELTTANSKSTSNTKESIELPISIISQSIHGKYSRIMKCESCEVETVSEDDFTVVSLQILSSDEVNVNLKFYPSEPVNKNCMIDYDFKFISNLSCIDEVRSKLKLQNKEEVKYEYYIISEDNNDLVPIDSRTQIKELGEVVNGKLKATIHMYKLPYLTENCKYYDFNLCVENKFGEVQPQTSVFKIPIDRNASLYEFHLAVYRHLMHSIRSYDENYFDEYFHNDAIEKGTRYYRIEFDFKPAKSKKCHIHHKKKSHVCEICADENIAFEQLLKAQEDKIKIVFRIIRLKPEYDTLNILEENKLISDPIIIESSYDCSFNSCLSKFIADEIYPDFSCDNCEEISNCIMKTAVSLLPKYLIIQLMRFQTDYSNGQAVLK